MNERIKAINEVLYCDKCDKDHPCIWINSESVAFNTTCPNDADWRPMFMGNHHGPPRPVATPQGTQRYAR